MKPRLYLETTIPSYLVARRSRDLRLAADQETTQDWWEQRRHNFDLFVSDLVLREARRGDAQFAAARLEKLRGIAILSASPAPNSLPSGCSGTGSSRPWPPMTPPTWALRRRTAWTFCSRGTAGTSTTGPWSAALNAPASPAD
jgi:hypothetical protein